MACRRARRCPAGAATDRRTARPTDGAFYSAAAIASYLNPVTPIFDEVPRSGGCDPLARDTSSGSDEATECSTASDSRSTTDTSSSRSTDSGHHDHCDSGHHGGHDTGGFSGG
jgi:hypothetical protein